MSIETYSAFWRCFNIDMSLPFLCKKVVENWLSPHKKVEILLNNLFASSANISYLEHLFISLPSKKVWSIWKLFSSSTFFQHLDIYWNLIEMKPYKHYISMRGAIITGKSSLQLTRGHFWNSSQAVKTWNEEVPADLQVR